jgi:uncharacterized protein YlxW (UPF0749 family)
MRIIRQNREDNLYGIGSSDETCYIKLLRRQLEEYIAEEFGSDRLSSGKNQTELKKIKKEMAELQKRLETLQARRTEIEKAMKK